MVTTTYDTATSTTIEPTYETTTSTTVEPTLKIQPEEKQMEDVLGGGSDVIYGTDYDYPDEKTIPFKDVLAKEIGNLDFESGQFWSSQSPLGFEGDEKGLQAYIPIFNSTKPIGYDNKDGGKPIFIHEAIGEDASNAEKLEYIYNTVTYNRDTVSETKDVDAVRDYRDNQGQAWTSTKDGRTFSVDWTKQDKIGAVQNIFGKFLPLVDSRKEALNRKRVELELAEMGLTPDTAKDLREQLKESHWYIKDGKIQYNEETKDLSYLIPNVNDYSFEFQSRQILGNIVDDFPSLLMSGYAALSKGYQTSDMAPNENLLNPEKQTNIFGMSVKALREGKFEFPKGDDLLKSDEDLRADINLYEQQKQVELDFVTELTSYFDEKKQTSSLWAPFKNLHKNIVYNNTGFEMTGKMVEAFENPTDSFMYHATDIIAEGLPYIATIEGVAMAYGIRGTMIYNNATDYVLANTGQGLKHSNPIKALNYFLKNHVTNEKMKSNPSKFIQKTMKRLDERQASAFGTKKLKANLQKEIGSVNKQIDDAMAKGDSTLIEKLSVARDTLIKNQLDLTPRYWTKGDKSLFKNEVFASVFGGVGRDIFGDGGTAAFLEIIGAFAEPFMFTQGVKGIGKSAALMTARILDSASFIPTVPAVRDYLLGKSISLKPEDILITDAATGLQRKLTVSETKSIKKFINIVDGMPSDQRLDILSSMNMADESLKVLLKDLPEDQQDAVKFTLSQYTGLAALQAVAEMYNVQKLSTVFTSSDLVKINNQMGESANLITVIDNSMSTLLEKNPNNPQVQNFVDKIQENIRLINDDLNLKASEFDAALEAMVDLEKGLNLFDNAGALDKNVKSMVEMLEDIKSNGFSDSAKQTSNNLLQNLDQKILDDMKSIADNLGNDGEDYKVNGFASIISALKQVDKIKYKQAYSKLYDTDKNFTLDFTEYFDDMMGGLFPEGRFGKLKKATGIISNKLPSSSETKKFVDVVNSSTERSTVNWMMNNSNKDDVLKAWSDVTKIGEEGQEETMALIIRGNLTEDESIKLLDSFKKQLKKNNDNFKDVPESSITGVDIRDFFLGFENVNIPVKMNLQEALEFKSGLGTFAYIASEKSAPKSKTFMEMYNEVEGVLFTAMNNSGNDELITNYAEAVNAFRSYIGKYNSKRFKDLKKWTKTTDNGSQLKVTQDKGANSTKKLEKHVKQDDYANSIYKQVTGKEDADGIARFGTETNPSTWIQYDKLLYDEVYADNFMKEVVAPLVGKRDVSKIVEGSMDDIPYIVDMKDPETIKRLEVVRGFLQEGMANWFRRTPQGKLVIGENATKKILAEDKLNLTGQPIKLDVNNKIKISDEASSWYKLTSTDGDTINLLNINNLVNTNLSFDTLLARNTFIGELTVKNNKSFSKVFKNAKKETKKQLEDYKYAKTQLGGNAILLNFSNDLKNSKTFVDEIIIGNGDLSQYNKLKEVIVGTGPGKISANQFDTLTKELFAKEFYTRFSISARAKDTTKTLDGKPVKELNVAPSFFENVLGAKLFLQENNKNLVGIFGKEHIDNMDAILNITMLKSGVSTSDITKAKLPQSLSVESLISRLYSINRGIISPKYVATEVSLQRFRKSKAHMMEELIKSPELAKVVRKVLESDNIYKDNISNATLEKFLNKSVVNAILLRESAEFAEEKYESSQDELLNELNQELSNVQGGL